jgi:hypothetical protein
MNAPIDQANPPDTNANASSGSPNTPALRILCLHDVNSNAKLLKESLDILGQRLFLQHQVDFVYLNSPLVATAAAENETDDPSERIWWFEGQDGHQQEEQQQDQGLNYRGLDASLLLLRQVWTSVPFWGILGVGQGAGVASIMTLLPDLQPPPAFSIFINGQAILEEDELLLEGFSCLHVTDEQQHRQQQQQHEQQDRLIRQFGGQVYARAETAATGGATRTTLLDKADMNAIGRFVVDQKKEMRAGGPASDALALRTALHYTEAHAADEIAKQIAEDPPSALMAVIRPQAVAGWNGNKRRQPGEQGGGAPCPSEFLLHREKRQQSEGPERMHPEHQDEGNAY